MCSIQRISSVLFKCNRKKQIDIIRITILYVKVSLLINLIPLRIYYRKYFKEYPEQFVDLSTHMTKIQFIRRILHFLPGKCTCLKECIVVHLYFKRFDFYIPIYLGLSIEDGLRAHAWYDPDKSENFHRLDHIKDERK